MSAAQSWTCMICNKQRLLPILYTYYDVDNRRDFEQDKELRQSRFPIRPLADATVVPCTAVFNVFGTSSFPACCRPKMCVVRWLLRLFRGKRWHTRLGGKPSFLVPSLCSTAFFLDGSKLRHAALPRILLVAVRLSER